jgi:serine/threonine protein kinase
MLLEPGYKLINRYEIKRSLGDGTFGTVYLAFDHRMKKDVAIKELKSEWLIDEVVRKRFINDAWAMGSLDENDNVVTVHDLLEPDIERVESYYIIMQFMRGGSLEGLIRREHTLPVKDSLRITIEVCRALEAAHKIGIVHRDIKPDNILLSSSGGAKLSDFGVAHIPGSGSSGSRSGTLIWLAPEQAKGEKHIDGRADLYSLTAVLYRMLTGRYYIDFETCMAKARKSAQNENEEAERRIVVKQVCDFIVETRPRRPGVFRPDIPVQLDVDVLKGLAEQPADRFQTAMEMANALSVTLKSITDEHVSEDLDRVQTLIGEDRFEEAARIIQKVLRKDDSNASAHELMGEIHHRRGEYSSAALQWEKAVKLPAVSTGIFLKLGKLYNRLEYFKEAARTFQKGLEYNHDDSNLYYGLAVALWENGNYKDAIEALTSSCHLHPDKRKEALLARWKQQMNLKQKDIGDRTLHE